MIFYVVRISHAPTQDILNLMRFVCAPDAKRTAHITVRGPYTRRLQKPLLRKLYAFAKGADISVIGAGTFFAARQNTVFLHCHSMALKAVWKKPDYPCVPHITIYDGGSRTKAKQVYQVLMRAKVHFIRSGDGMNEMISPAHESALRPAINEKVLSAVCGKKTDTDAITKMPWATRLRVLQKLTARLPKLLQ